MIERRSPEMQTIDLKKQFSELYKPSAKVPSVVEVPPLRFLMIDGVGDVGGASYQPAVQAMYSLAYSTKFEAKKRLGLAYPVMPLEGLYWDPSGEREFTAALTESLCWRLLLMLPDEVPSEFVDEVRAKVAAKKDVARLSDVKVQTLSEGVSVQILHIGPYAEETGTIDRLLSFAEERGLDVVGKHHEIYLGDPRRSAPEKLKTVLRYGVRRR
jgi:hypothetical protein